MLSAWKRTSRVITCSACPASMPSILSAASPGYEVSSCSAEAAVVVAAGLLAQFASTLFEDIRCYSYRLLVKHMWR